jgi:hypothetical protein
VYPPPQWTASLRAGWRTWKWDPRLSVEERGRLLSSFLQAVRLSLSDPRSIELDSDEEAEAGIKREKVCLRELTGKYAKLVDQWGQLERLSFDDPQLLEASKTFLYGFYRASVVLRASAVETRLRQLAGGSDQAYGFELIKAAEKRKLIRRDLADHARDVFQIRNRVVHDNQEPPSDQAKEVLGLARMLVAEMQ